MAEILTTLDMLLARLCCCEAEVRKCRVHGGLRQSSAAFRWLLSSGVLGLLIDCDVRELTLNRCRAMGVSRPETNSIHIHNSITNNNNNIQQRNYLRVSLNSIISIITQI